MQSEWQDLALGEFVRLQRGHDLTGSEQRPGRVPVMGSAGPNGTHSDALAKGPGVVVGRSGASIGRVHYSPVDFWPHNTCLYVTDFLGNHPRFAYYLLQTLDLAGYNSGSAQPSLNRNYIYGIRLQVPSPDLQARIVAVLQALDDRIELLLQTSATLDSIVQALFKSWFIDFDPVRAKAEGREPEGMDAGTAALFPAEFGESELGVIPNGWRTTAIQDVVENIYDGPHATPSDAAHGPVFLGIKNLTGTSIDLTDVRNIAEADWARWTKRVTPRANDIVFSYEAALGLFALIPPGLRCCLGRRLALVRPKQQTGTPHFWFHQFIGAPFQRLLDKHTVHGATVNRIALKEFPSFTVMDPGEQLRTAFESVTQPLWARIHANGQQALNLAELRDALLPRLISGKVHLPEAQEQLEGATD